MFPVEALILEELVVVRQMSPLVLVRLQSNVHGGCIQVQLLKREGRWSSRAKPFPAHSNGLTSEISSFSWPTFQLCSARSW